MITEDYVSFEVAKLLKEKGFDCACKVWYSEYTSQFFGGKKYTSIEFDDHNMFDENYKFICYAPTLQMAMKWLREEKNLNIEVNLIFDRVIRDWFFGYGFCIISLKGPDYEKLAECDYDEYKTYEEACEAAIKYCLENLI